MLKIEPFWGETCCMQPHNNKVFLKEKNKTKQNEQRNKNQDDEFSLRQALIKHPLLKN